MITTFGILTPTTAVVLLVVAVFIFGPGKLPDLGKSLGRGIKEFRSATTGLENVESTKDLKKG